jgi:hypothetical protein
MMKLIVNLFLVSLVSASARLGETRQEIAARYGEARTNLWGATNMVIFATEHFAIMVTFHEARSVCETVRPHENRTAQQFFQDQVMELRDRIDGATNWLATQSPFVFITPGTNITVTWFPTHQLSVENSVWRRARDKAQDAWLRQFERRVSGVDKF